MHISRELGSVDYQLRALWALWVDATNHGHPREALTLAERFGELSGKSDDRNDAILADRLKARSQHFLGNQPEAQRLITRMLDSYVPPANRSDIVRFQYDQRITAHITFERVLWLRGFTDRAMKEVETNIAHAQARDHASTMAHALSHGACPVALLAGELHRAERYIDLLRTLTQENALDVWNTYAIGYAGDLLIRQGRAADGIDQLRNCLARLRQTNFVLYLTGFLCSLASGHIREDDPEAAEAAVDEALSLVTTNGEMWLTPELYRMKAEIACAKASAEGEEVAEAWLRKSVALAREQGAASWELRSAIDLGRLMQRQDRPLDGKNELVPILNRFPANSGSREFRTAARLAEELNQHSRV